MHILVVDDFATMRRIIKTILNTLGFKNIEEAVDGTDALLKLRKGTFDFIISDWNMQPMTGLDLLKQVRTDAILRNIPFIMVTAEGKPENILAAKQAGVNNYVVKPFNAETLKTKMMSVIGSF